MKDRGMGGAEVMNSSSNKGYLLYLEVTEQRNDFAD